jgi:hypothetical protein
MARAPRDSRILHMSRAVRTFITAACAALAAAAGAGCAEPPSPAVAGTGCPVDATGTYVCGDYAAAYPYDFDFVDPMYGTAWGYYPYAFDTYYDPLAVAASTVTTPPTPTGSDVPELLTIAHHAADGINAGLRTALDPIKSLLQTAPQIGAGWIVFGPAIVGGGSYRFMIASLAAADHRFGWRLEVRPAAAQATSTATGGFTLAAGGVISVGAEPRLGRGAIAVYCDAIAANDPQASCRGRLVEGFSNAGGDKLLQIALTAFTPDAAAIAPLDAAAFAWRSDFTSNAVRLVWRANLADTPTAAPELVVVKLRWTKDVGVRADAVATGGGVPAGQTLPLSTCVGPDLQATAAAGVVGPGPSVMPTSCPAGLDAADPPAADPKANDPPAGMPLVPTIPTTFPDPANPYPP